MFSIYALYSEDFDKIYIGYSSNLEERLISHNFLGTTGWTIKYRPWKLIYSEQYQTKQEAMKREKELKSYRGRQFIRSQIQK